MKHSIACLLALLLAPQFVSAQGHLAPPGPPGPTMKTLEQIEPRTPISALPYDINEPGSYYLTQNLTGMVNSNGITINTNHVSIDLNGFALLGVANSSDGIAIPYVSGYRRDIAIRNGSITLWGGAGIEADYARNVRITDIHASSNGTHGVHAGIDCVISHCATFDNGNDGIVGERGSTVSHCNAYRNGGYGVYVEEGSSISHCAAYNNGSVGIIANSGGSSVSHCASYDNNGDGFFAADSVSFCSAKGNTGWGIYSYGGNVVGCAVTWNTSGGIFLGDNGRASDCQATSNTGDGIHMQDNCQVLDSISAYNGSGGDGAGIRATGGKNRIEGNNLPNNDRGVYVSSSQNLIVRNSASGNSTNYAIAAGNDYGAIISNPGTNFSSSNPWANFEF